MSAQPTKQNKGSRWGSLLSGAVAGLESRLDTILAEDDQASAKSRAVEVAARQSKATDQGISRTSSTRSQTNNRLQERLAKAVVKGADGQRPVSRQSSELPSRTATPGIDGETTRSSIDSKASEAPAEAAASQPANDEPSEPKIEPEPVEPLKPLPAPTEQPSPEQPTDITIAVQPAENKPEASPRQSLESPRPSLDATHADTSPPSPTRLSAIDSDLELSQLREAHATQASEIHSHLERIDALQAKLQYLSRTAAEAAHNTALNANPGSLERKLADKDEQIALLLDEGQRLSKTELKHMNVIKKLRAQKGEEEKANAELRRKLANAERQLLEATERAKRAEGAEKAAAERMRVLGRIEKDVEALRNEKEDAARVIVDLKRQVAEADARAEEAEKRVQIGALEAERKIVSDLRDEIEDTKIQKKLVEDRARAEIKDVKEGAMRQQEHAKVMEIELRGEITSLETKLELLRSRTEESTAGTDTQTKLLRQIETLQTQYALASENWHGIESTLTSRVAALEKERDETVKRESDVRRKARDVNSKSRRLEEELEAVHDRARSLEHDMQEQAAAMTKLQSRLSGAETALNDAKETFEQEKKVWEAEMTQRVEDEKLKWRLESSNINNSQHQGLGLVDSGQYLQSPTTTGASLSQPHRRHHSPSPAFGEQNTYRRPIPRTFSSEVGALSPPPIPDTRSHSQSRRSSRQPHPGTPPLRQDSLPSLSTHLNGAPSHLGSVSQTPSIHAFDPDDAFDSTSSPHRTIADMLSTSASGAGPSVQLVERMSAAVRRLESEKAVVKEEMARLAAQRDGAREEVVALLREVEEKRGLEERVAGMRRELEEVGVRYATTLEMLGEKSEEVEELRADVVDLKRIYRELVESTVK